MSLKIKTEFSNVDVAALVQELKPLLIDAFIDNIYQLCQVNDLFFFKLRPRHGGSYLLLIELGKRFHLTEFSYVFPKIPPGFCSALRKHVRGSHIINIEQWRFDRIIVLDLKRGDKHFRMIIELFGRGNLILLDEEEKILMAKFYRKMRDRDLIPKAKFEFAPARGSDFFTIGVSDLKNLLSISEIDIIRTLVKEINIGGLYGEEICMRANIDPMKPAKELSDEEIRAVYLAIEFLGKKIMEKDFESVIVLTDDQVIDVTPIRLKIYEDKGLKMEKSPSFNKACDEYFSRLYFKKDIGKEVDKIASEVKKLEKILDKQEDRLKEIEYIAENYRKIGDAIYNHAHELEEILQTLNKVRREGFSWEEIVERLKEGAEKGIKLAEIVKSMVPKKGIMIVEIDDLTVEIDITKSVTENATKYYQSAKKAAKKIPSAKKALGETLKKIEERKSGRIVLEEKEVKPLKKRQKQWYEKYHWFISSDGVLVIGGRDAKTNEELVKKHLKEKDIFLHAEVHGAPHTIIKLEQLETVPEITLSEAAQFAVSYSKGWKEKLGAVDAYWVKPSQVSFSAPSGQYLPKGGVMIYGERNYLKGMPLELGIGLDIREDFAQIVGGPLTTIQKQSRIYVSIKPNNEPKGKIARKIKDFFLKNVEDEEKEKVKVIDLNEIITFIPGPSKIAETETLKRKKRSII